MIRKLIVPTILIVLLLITACSTPHTQSDIDTAPTANSEDLNIAMNLALPFEEAATFATDVVVAQYVGYRYIGTELNEYEFTVIDRVLGNAEDTIYLIRNRANSLSFRTETEYLLMLERIRVPFYYEFHDESFVLISDTAIDLNDPLASAMHNSQLSEHLIDLNLTSRNFSTDQVVSHFRNLTLNNSLPSREPIRSDRLEDIIDGSPHVVIIEITKPRRLSRRPEGQRGSDIYYFTVVQALKGGLEEGHSGTMLFIADTVQTGERHIVAVDQRLDGGNFRFTSRHSLLRMDQLDEILAVLDHQNNYETP